MWIEKLTDGVIQLDTPIGSRYLQPSLLQRAYLIWTFRNFFSLPQQVLRPRERQLIDRLWSEKRFVPVSRMGGTNRPVIGIIERRNPERTNVVSMRKPPASVKPSSNPAVAEQGREAASA
jgi:hypothetical protein